MLYSTDDSLEILRYGVVSTTMEVAKNDIVELPNKLMLVTAEEQTKGIGRNNSFWCSPKGGFYGTYVIPLNRKRVTKREMNLLHYAPAISIVQTLRELYNLEDTNVKWPNDIYLRNNKLGGILIDVASFDRSYLLIGIGVNLNTDQKDLSNVVDISTISVSEELGQSVRTDVFEETLTRILFKNLSYVMIGTPNIATYLNEVLYNKNKKHEYKSKTYICKGITSDYALFLTRAGREDKYVLIQDSDEVELIE